MNRPTHRPPVLSWALYDFANSAFATTIMAVIFNRYYAEVIAGGPHGAALGFGRFSLHLPGASWFTFAVSASMVLVALVAPILGAVADYSGSRKRFLFAFFVLGVIGTAFMAGVGPGDLAAATILLIIANIGFACANVFYNAFLTDISSPDNIGWVSGFGWALGYLGGGLLLLLNLVMLRKPELLGFPAGTFTVHHCFLSVAVWWALFSVPLFANLRDRKVTVERLSPAGYARAGFRRLAGTFRDIRRYRELFKFLAAYFLYNDGIQTVLIVTAIFGAEVVGMDASEMIVYFLMIQFVAFAGSLVLGRLADRWGNRRVVLATLVVWSVVVIWAYRLGFLLGPEREFWLLGILGGTVMGGSQAAGRSLLGILTPKDKSAEFFGFYAVAGKFSSIFGPLIYGLAIVWTGGVRRGILSLIVFFIAGILMLLAVNEGRGRVEAAGEDRGALAVSGPPV